jgi:ankyrin repeat protein
VKNAARGRRFRIYFGPDMSALDNVRGRCRDSTGQLFVSPVFAYPSLLDNDRYDRLSAHQSRRRALYDLAVAGNTDGLNEMLAFLGPVDVAAACGGGSRYCPLSAACGQGSSECVRALLRVGVSPDARDASGTPALARAARAGHRGCVVALLAGGASPSARTRREQLSALQLARAYGHTACIEALVAEQVCEAAASGRLVRLSRLLRGGDPKDSTDDASPTEPLDGCEPADPRRLARSVSAQGRPALFLACLHGRTDCAVLLLNLDADVDWQAEASGATALLAAARHGHAGCVAALLRHGASTSHDSHAYGGDLQAAARASRDPATIRLAADPLTIAVSRPARKRGSAEQKDAPRVAPAHIREANLHLQLASALRAAEAEKAAHAQCRKEVELLRWRLADLDDSGAHPPPQRQPTGHGEAATPTLQDDLRARLTAASSSFDVDGSGALSMREVRAALQAVGVHADRQEVKRVFQAYDADGDGTLDLDEFARLAQALLESEQQPAHATDGALA